jgi:hypothetical protein
MKSFILVALCSFMLASCATMGQPITMLKPGKEETMKKNLYGKTLKQIHKGLGHPASPGHWGVGEYAFIVLYPIGDDKSIPTWKYGMAKKSMQCYFLRFNKEKNLTLDNVEVVDCAAPISNPDRVDWDFLEANT